MGEGINIRSAAGAHTHTDIYLELCSRTLRHEKLDLASEREREETSIFHNTRISRRPFYDVLLRQGVIYNCLDIMLSNYIGLLLNGPLIQSYAIQNS